MTLTTYKQKRNFKKTAEPTGKKKKSQASLLFVVQQHAASRLHYDFRLEMEGVLKSWAVPKGPSLNPDDKRLAVMVEDHPYDYKDFEGTIPKGNYGAGNVIVWDNGTYHALGTDDKKESEKKLSAGLKKGHISFILEGKKLKGEFALVKIRTNDENHWLLIKKNDKYASGKDVLKNNRSVMSKKTLNDFPAKENKVKRVRKKPALRKKKLEQLKPMLAELGDTPFNNPDWVFEIKYDGYRALAQIDNGDVNLYSRNLLSFNKAFAPVVEELKNINHDVLLDGEVVVEDEKGLSKFQLLQNFQKTGTGEIKYYVFDLLRLDGTDTRHLTLLERKELVWMLLSKARLKNVFYSEHIKEKGEEFYKLAIKNKLEGMIAKDAVSPYRAGQRSSEWLKIKISRQEEAIIAGITEPKGSRNHFGSLVLGIYENDTLKYAGNCGTGFNEETLRTLYKKFKPFITSTSPFNEKIKTKGKVTWIKPKFVCQVKFTEWTSDGHMRHPVYLGLRTDKNPKEVMREAPKSKSKKSASAKKNTETDFDLKVGKINVHLTNQHKIYFPDDKITKGDLVRYYDEISSFMLPYLKDRPQSMNRFPNGIKGESFYQKDVDRDKIPAWLKTEKVYSESNKKHIDYLVCNDKATLLYMANLGCIEINPWNSQISRPENPDWAVIDLDPEKIAFKEVVRAALEVKNVMDELNAPCYCKTSGATGLHIYIPLAGRYDYDVVKTFAEVIAQTVYSRLPETTSVLRMPSKRQGKVYLDFLQNRRGQTLAAPYSVRPKPGATVSTPLEWKEVNDKLNPDAFTIHTTFKRLEKKGDLWKPVLGKGANLDKVVKKIYEK